MARYPKCRAPHGARGLKFLSISPMPATMTSRPARGAWIEISTAAKSSVRKRSRPARGAWIEICCTLPLVAPAVVAPRTGRVD